ncbi:MAG: hypothetical protein J7641_02980 [Cyanobacteria bacterium SID2]|nr:hypothetical protein [Cyanobacteria bacterium SID2]MBP0006517.1 hypothetical protein [Cyanobacteria bacterium SBC]
MLSAAIVPFALASLAVLFWAGTDEEIEGILAGVVAIVCSIVALCLSPISIQLLVLVLCLAWHTSKKSLRTFNSRATGRHH